MMMGNGRSWVWFLIPTFTRSFDEKVISILSRHWINYWMEINEPKLSYFGALSSLNKNKSNQMKYKLTWLYRFLATTWIFPACCISSGLCIPKQTWVIFRTTSVSRNCSFTILTDSGNEANMVAKKLQLAKSLRLIAKCFVRHLDHFKWPRIWLPEMNNSVRRLEEKDPWSLL